MCNLDSVSGLIIAAEAAAVAVLAALAIAVVLRGSLYTAFASTVPMVAALIAIAIAISSLSAAAAILNNCLGGSCNTQVRALQTAIGGLISAFTVIGVAIGVGMAFPIPWVGAAAVVAIIVGMAGASLAFGFIGADLAALAACERMSSTVISTAGTVGFVVGGILGVGVVGLTGYGVYKPQMSGDPRP